MDDEWIASKYHVCFFIADSEGRGGRDGGGGEVYREDNISSLRLVSKGKGGDWGGGIELVVR